MEQTCVLHKANRKKIIATEMDTGDGVLGLYAELPIKKSNYEWKWRTLLISKRNA